MGSRRLTLLSRPACHLCDEFREELEQHFGGLFTLELACVDDRPDWRQLFGREIPVLLAEDGSPLCRTRLEPEAVRRYLSAPPDA